MSFTLPATQWPIPGYPAWVIVDAVDMPMVKIRSKFSGEPMWVNASIIERVWDVRPLYDEPTMICDLCEADRYKEPCRGNWQDCPMRGEAAQQSTESLEHVETPAK